MTISHPTSTTDEWTAALQRLLPRAAIAGPALMTLAALCVTAGIARLPGDLDWISETEGLLGMLAVPFLFATWIVVGRAIATRAPRTGIAVTLLGAVAAGGWAFPMSMRLFSADLVLNGVSAEVINETWESDGTLSAMLAFGLMSLMIFVVAIVAGVAVLKTRVAPKWAGIALLLFPPLFMTAQAAYVAIELTYPLACALLLAGVIGVVTADQRNGT